ncbi:MAG: general secretion pathway protein GspH [Methylomonas sp.]|nr:MAG: general secretion pathway protein GspH [Methylomonas sp.]
MIRRHKGFSLLEILVAFAIMAVALTIVLRIFGSGVNNAVISEEYSLAVQIAESIMARTGVETPLQIGEISGSEADKYAWWIRITPVAGPPPKSRPRFKSQEQVDDRPVMKLMAVQVRVSWGDRTDQQRAVELHNLRLVQEPAS